MFSSVGSFTFWFRFCPIFPPLLHCPIHLYPFLFAQLLSTFISIKSCLVLLPYLLSVLIFPFLPTLLVLCPKALPQSLSVPVMFSLTFSIFYFPALSLPFTFQRLSQFFSSSHLNLTSGDHQYCRINSFFANNLLSCMLQGTLLCFSS